jgi:surfeit locus 1 family protein
VSERVRHEGNGTRGTLEAARPSLWLTALSLAAFATLVGLGIWQIERRDWKLALIDRVERRIHAPASQMPSPAFWPAVTAASDEYRHVSASGRFLFDRETLIKAVTDEGAGYWLLTPLQRDDGTTVLVNRGFVPAGLHGSSTPRAGDPQGLVSITGLLRMTEPGGGFLRTNDPVNERWYSRDLAAIAAARGLRETAPFFIDADAAPDAGVYPIGGLTVVRFPNNHLIYALTWFTLAFMLVGWLLVTFGGGLFRRQRIVRMPAGRSHAEARRTGSDAGTIAEPT